MGILNIGEIIKSERKKKNVTQEELSFGLCTTATLSRIENGQHAPSRSLVSALLERLGDVDYDFSYINVEDSPFDFEIDRLKTTIMNCYEVNHLDAMMDSLKQLESKGIDYDLLDKQFLKTYQFIYKYKTGQSQSLDYDDIKNTLMFTIKNYDETAPLSYILTNNEQKLIFLIAIYHKLHGQPQMATDLFDHLAKNQEQFHAFSNYRNVSYIDILTELIRQYMIMNCYEKTYDAIQRYLTYCKQHTLYSLIPLVKYDKACCEVSFGKIEDARESILDAYFHLYALQQVEQAESLRKKAATELGIIFHIKLQRGEKICKTSTLDTL